MNVGETTTENVDFPKAEVENQVIDPIEDIIDYLVRCANISFKNAHVQEKQLRTADKVKLACDLYKQSPTRFLLQFGKYLSPNHLEYFKNIQPSNDYDNINLRECIAQLDRYHSTKARRVRNRRYKALQKLQQETNYFTDKEMMLRNPLLYEQLVGQYLTDDEIRERDSVDGGDITLLSMILETIDRSDMREFKNEQILEESKIDDSCFTNNISNSNLSSSEKTVEKQWGAFDIPNTEPSHTPETRGQAMINANERNLLREEFLQEMFSSFIEGRDVDFDYETVDNNEEFDDLLQISQDAEDKYFDSETNESETLEEHMELVEMYKNTNLNDDVVDPLDEFMEHISKKVNI